MGVRGLTTFIAQNSDRYLKPFELHDTYLVVDGNNLAAQLYKWHAKCYDCFGGDYDKYAQTVINFFGLLRECNIIPLIVFDGGYEDKKLKTVYSRVKTRIKQARMLDSITENSMTVFPLFLRELFVELILKLNLKVVRCSVEADFEMACIARKLKCPLLSYDSDFFIFDVEYIPFNTLVLNSVKRSKLKYKYLECQVYKVEYFLKVYGGLQKECIPLLGVLLGNDYIHIRVFSNFYRQLKKSKSKPGSSDQQRRIKSLIKWLQTETFDSAIRKILGRTKQVYRHKVAEQILSVANNYICSESDLLKYFNLDLTFTNETVTELHINVEDIENIDIEESDVSEDSENEEAESSIGSDVDTLIECDDDSVDIVNLPEHFEDKYRRGLYAACFIDIVLHNRYIFVPAIENYSQPQCHKISLNILSGIYKILKEDSAKNLKYILRNEKGRMHNFKLAESSKTLPKLNELPEVCYPQSLQYMLSVLEIDEIISNLINEFPASWRLYIISITYWIQNANPSVNECHICALLLTAILIKSIGVDFCRNESKFMKKYQKNILNIQSNKIEAVRNADMTAAKAIEAITKNDIIILMKEIISNFDMLIKMRKNPKLFDRDIIHMFAQFQSCALHIKYLNSLLNYPFEDYLISDFYNGTLLYNLTNNFLSRPQLDSYLELLMKNAPNVWSAFIVIKSCVQTHLSEKCVRNMVPKRKRKRKNKTPEIFIQEESVPDDDDEENLYDVNNRFSLLKIINSKQSHLLNCIPQLNL